MRHPSSGCSIDLSRSWSWVSVPVFSSTCGASIHALPSRAVVQLGEPLRGGTRLPHQIIGRVMACLRQPPLHRPPAAHLTVASRQPGLTPVLIPSSRRQSATARDVRIGLQAVGPDRRGAAERVHRPSPHALPLAAARHTGERGEGQGGCFVSGCVCVAALTVGLSFSLADGGVWTGGANEPRHIEGADGSPEGPCGATSAPNAAQGASWSLTLSDERILCGLAAATDECAGPPWLRQQYLAEWPGLSVCPSAAESLNLPIATEEARQGADVMEAPPPAVSL